MAIIPLTGVDSQSPTGIAKFRLRDLLSARFPDGEWVVWEQLEDEQPRESKPLASVRISRISTRGVRLESGLGREITAEAEIRLLGTPNAGGLCASKNEVSLLDRLADRVDAWLYEAKNGQTYDGKSTGFKAELEKLGLQISEIEPRRLTTDERDFAHVHLAPFTLKILVEGGLR